jgi:hypothetical protein
MSLQEAIDMVKAAGKIITTEDEQKMLVEARVADAVTPLKEDITNIKKAHGETLSKLDQELVALLGVDKGDRPTHTFAKEEIAKIKQDLEAAKVPVDDATKEIAKLKGLLEESTNKYESFVKESEENAIKSKYNTLQEVAMKEIRANLKDDLPEDVLELIIDSTLDKFSKEVDYKDVDGLLRFYDKDGNPILNEKDGSYRSINDLLTDKFQPIYKKSGEKQKTVLEILADKKGNPNIDLGLPAGINSDLDLYNYMIESGQEPNTPEFDSTYAELSKAIGA